MSDRTPHTDALATLGTIHTKQEKRDAIHLGVEPVTTKDMLLKGQYLVWHDMDKRIVKATFDNDPNAIGIVDPFLDKSVDAGEWFWLILLPRQITSLRHVWEHNSFPSSELQNTSSEDSVSPYEVSILKKKIQEYVDMLNREYYDSYLKEDYGIDPLTFDELVDGVRLDGYIIKGPMFDSEYPEQYGIELVRDYIKMTYSDSGVPSYFYFSCSC